MAGAPQLLYIIFNFKGEGGARAPILTKLGTFAQLG